MMELSDAVTVVRSGAEVAGTTERLGAQLLKWTPAEGAAWYPQQRYQISGLEVQDLAPSPSNVSTLPGQFIHLATYPDQTLVAWSAPDHSQRIPESRYGLTSLFQGRAWHDELGLYYFRARWYGSFLLDFLERDPASYRNSPNLKQANGRNSVNFIDPMGLYELDFHFQVVYLLAQSAGYPASQCVSIACASQFVDNYLGSQPMTPSADRLRAFHFLSPNGGRDPVTEYDKNPVAQNLIGWLEEEWLSMSTVQRSVSLGIALHSVGDTFSHQDYNAYWALWYGGDNINRVTGNPLVPDAGHAEAGSFPDKPYHRPEIATDAAAAIFRILRRFARIEGMPPRTTWSSLSSGIYERFRTLNWEDKHLRAREWTLDLFKMVPGAKSFPHYESQGMHEAPSCTANILSGEGASGTDWRFVSTPDHWYSVFRWAAQRHQNKVLALEGPDPESSKSPMNWTKIEKW